MNKCLNCGNTEQNIPLVNLSFKGDKAYICSRCLPVLIHHPEELAGKIEGAEKIKPAEHKD
jgi:hypothetical protein